jgi:hypothetical protein
MRSRSIAIVGSLAICASLLAAPAGAAKKLNSPTTIGPLEIIKDNPTQYLVSGKVVAKTAGCRFQRIIQLHVIHPNNTDTIVLSRKTKSGVGLFSFRTELQPREAVYVTTPAKRFVTKNGKRVHCAAGSSIPQFPT